MKISVFCGVSLDGFLARPDDTFDFLKAGEGVPHGFISFLRSVDVIVLGRRTFDVVRRLGHLELYGHKPLIVLSTRKIGLDSLSPRIEQMSGTPAAVVGRLKTRGFRHVYLDGGLTIQRFLRAGLVDDLTVTRVPALIGRGIPLFGPLVRDIQLRHLRTRRFPGGMVQSHYAVIKKHLRRSR